MARTAGFIVRALALGAAALTGSGALAQAAPPQEAPPEVAALLEAAAAELMKPGAKREDWNRGGTDIYALVAAAPGGAQRNYILVTDKDGGKSLIIVLDGAQPALPQSWQAVSRVGGPPPAGIATDLTVGGVMPPYFFTGVQGRRKVGDAFCASGPMSGALYRDSSARESTLPQVMVQLMFDQMIKQFQTTTICWRYDREGDSYRSSYYLEDGRSLPGMDAGAQQLRVVPADAVEKLLASPAGK